MIYSKLTEIKTKIIATGIFESRNVFLGNEFETGTNRMPLCVIKSGPAEISKPNVRAQVYIMALFYDADNVEQTVLDNLSTIARELHEVDNVDFDDYTTDSDIFEPFGVVVPVVPPYGGFRLNLLVHHVI